MNISQAVIRRIEELCRERHLSINALSNISGITQSTVNDIMNYFLIWSRKSSKVYGDQRGILPLVFCRTNRYLTKAEQKTTPLSTNRGPYWRAQRLKHRYTEMFSRPAPMPLLPPRI
ncbi:hypothetical protein SDC9_09233 [bioreactor metagenome]|uniref:Uncharacterized protein n=1 Tax=bioreactor metagenome TaxID=1076179 RepID=A0A644TBM4_9ZZZZ